MIFNLDKPIKCKMFGDVYQSRGNWHSGRTSDYYAIIYCTEGNIVIGMGEEVFHLEPGDLLLIPKGIFYKPLGDGGCRYYFLDFLAETLPESFEIPSYITVFKHPNLTRGYGYSTSEDYTSATKVRPYIKGAPYKVKSIFEKADKLHPNVNFPDQLSLDNLARELLIIMGESEQTKVDEKIAQILNYVHAHYAEDVSLSALAKRFSLSESYIARLFREKVGTKPASYVNRVRISAAKELILGTDCPMSEIAEKIGFSDTYYFSNTFKKFEGTSPSQFRKRYTN